MSITIQQPELDVATALAAAGLGTLGTDIKYGKVISPDDVAGAGVSIWCVPIFETSEPFHGATSSGDAQGFLFTSRVQVSVLGPADDFEGAMLKARQVRDALNGKDTAVVSQAVPALPYTGGVLHKNGPHYLGPRPEANGVDEVVVEFDLKWKAVT